MIINNPTTLAGYGSTSQENYKLATVGQLNTKIVELDNKVARLLNGVHSYDGGELVPTEKTFGYAWLGADGKIDQALLPSLAITMTYVAGLDTVVSGQTGPCNTISDFYDCLGKWCNTAMSADPAEYPFQQGDVIIVVPSGTLEPGDIGSSTSDVEHTSGDSYDVKLDENVKFLGTYIISKREENADLPGIFDFTFAKMAYTDSNIVTINGKAPANSTGQLSLYLTDILSVGQGDNPSDLSKNLFKVTSDSVSAIVDEDGKTYERFAFRSAPTETGEDKTFGYATIDELNNAFNSLSAQLNTSDEAIAGINSKLGLNNTEKDMSIEENYQAATRLSAPVFDQLQAARYAINYNSIVLDKVRNNTVTYLHKLFNSVNNLKNSLNSKAVTLVEVPLVWADTDKKPEAIIESGVETHDWSHKFQWPESVTNEKIIAVYDQNNDKVITDISFEENNNVKSNVVTVRTEGTLVGLTWSVIIARTIDDIAIEYETDMYVGPSGVFSKRDVDSVKYGTGTTEVINAPDTIIS